MKSDHKYQSCHLIRQIMHSEELERARKNKAVKNSNRRWTVIGWACPMVIVVVPTIIHFITIIGAGSTMA